MSKMSELDIDILDQLEQGRAPAEIAVMLDIPISWIFEVIETNFEECSPYATLNS